MAYFKLCLCRTHLRYIINLRIYVSVLVHNIDPREIEHCDKSATKQIGTSSIRPRKITRSTEPLCDAELLVIRDVQLCHGASVHDKEQCHRMLNFRKGRALYGIDDGRSGQEVGNFSPMIVSSARAMHPGPL